MCEVNCKKNQKICIKCELDYNLDGELYFKKSIIPIRTGRFPVKDFTGELL